VNAGLLFLHIKTRMWLKLSEFLLNRISLFVLRGLILVSDNMPFELLIVGL
jgi:hypothetical protein